MLVLNYLQILESIALKERERALARWSSLPTFSTKDASPNGSGSSSPVTPASPKEKSLPSQNRSRNPPLLGLFRDPSTKFSTNSNSAHLTKRNEFLSYIQNYDFSRILTTMYSKRAVSVPRNSVKFIDLSFGGYMKSIKISYKALMLKVNEPSNFSISLVTCTYFCFICTGMDGGNPDCSASV